MAYVFSKALTDRDVDERLRKQLPLMNTNNIPPPASFKPITYEQRQRNQTQNVPAANNIKPALPVKPVANKAGQRPIVKRKPLVKSQSVDSNAGQQQHAEIDLTQVGDSEWRDFVLKRKQEFESEETDEEYRIATIKSLNLHRKSLTGAEQVIVEDRVLETLVPNETESNEKECIKDTSMPTVIDTDRNTSQTPTENDILPREPVTKLADVTNSSDILDEKCTKVTETTTVVDNVVNIPPVGITLPKPRQIGSELKRKSFATNRSMSLPASQQQSHHIKRSSDMFKETASNQPPSQTPYFCRHSRASVDIQDMLGGGLADLSIKELPENDSNDT